jgi:hypothetical protein
VLLLPFLPTAGEQHLGLASFFGETEHFVKGVRRVEP